jgi:hypothetical protein
MEEASTNGVMVRSMTVNGEQITETEEASTRLPTDDAMLANGKMV